MYNRYITKRIKMQIASQSLAMTYLNKNFVTARHEAVCIFKHAVIHYSYFIHPHFHYDSNCNNCSNKVSYSGCKYSIFIATELYCDSVA